MWTNSHPGILYSYNNKNCALGSEFPRNRLWPNLSQATGYLRMTAAIARVCQLKI